MENGKSSTALSSIGLSSSGSSSTGLATSGLSSYVGTGIGGNLPVPVMMEKLEISFAQSHRNGWFVPS